AITDPLSGFSNPAMMLSKVDFPQPLAPTRQTNSPSPTFKLTRSSACTVPVAVLKVLETLSIASLLGARISNSSFAVEVALGCQGITFGICIRELSGPLVDRGSTKVALSTSKCRSISGSPYFSHPAPLFGQERARLRSSVEYGVGNGRRYPLKLPFWFLPSTPPPACFALRPDGP